MKMQLNDLSASRITYRL